MPAYTGKFDYQDSSGTALQQGACEISFDSETCTVTPTNTAPLAFDLGDIDVFTPGEWDLTLRLYTGKRIRLRQFGSGLERMCQELLAAWRDRTVQCLLLEDLREVARFTGAANGTAAEVRIYGSNVAVLPLGAPCLQWRLATIDSIGFDDATYTFQLVSGANRLAIGKLGQKTEEFGEKLRATLDALHRSSAVALHQTFPFLNPDQLQQLVARAREGSSVRLAALAEVHPGLPDAVVKQTVSESLRPYFEFLSVRSVSDGLMTGFKFIRPDEQGGGSEEDGATAENVGGASTNGSGGPLLFWFFFALAPGGVAAWEATTGSGRATYFFRISPPAEGAMIQLTKGLALVNFRREPIYLSDAALDRQAEFHRYAIGRRKLPELADLRTAFLGRAIHSSLDAWKDQTEKIMTAK